MDEIHVRDPIPDQDSRTTDASWVCGRHQDRRDGKADVGGGTICREVDHFDFVILSQHLDITNDERSDLSARLSGQPSRDNEYFHASTLSVSQAESRRDRSPAV